MPSQTEHDRGLSKVADTLVRFLPWHTCVGSNEGGISIQAQYSQTASCQEINEGREREGAITFSHPEYEISPLRSPMQQWYLREQIEL